MSSTLDRVKTALRIRNTAFDEDEIQPIIDACIADLRLAGVGQVYEEDPLVQRAVVLYAKANFGFEAESEKYREAYEHLKASMSLAGDYSAFP